MLVAAALALVTMSAVPPPPPAPREFRAAWIATVDNIDWPSRRDLSTAQQQAELIALLDQAQALNLNAIIFQIRPHGDALYKSSIEPWSEYLTGQQGRPPNPEWDPLAFAIREAHRRGLELHAWFNPYRAHHPAAKSPIHSSHIAKTNPELVKTYGTFLWMDPGEPKVQERTLSVMLDVVRRYDLDGVHIDDYFYPYPVRDAAGKDVPFPDGPSYAAYRARGGTLKIGDWRRRNVDQMVERIHREVKRAKPWVRFGISPFGIYRPGIPAGIRAGIDQYDQLYADALKWFREGWCDYFTPQLYWAIDPPAQSYPALLTWWASQNPKGRHLWPGNFTSRLLDARNTWTPEEITRQIEITRKEPRAGGNVHFSMKALAQNARGIAEALATGPYRQPVAPPATPWLDAQPPTAPALSLAQNPAMGPVVQVRQLSADARFLGLYVRVGERWVFAGLSGIAQKEFNLAELRTDYGQVTAVAVSVFDRVGNEGVPAVLATP